MKLTDFMAPYVRVCYVPDMLTDCTFETMRQILKGRFWRSVTFRKVSWRRKCGDSAVNASTIGCGVGASAVSDPAFLKWTESISSASASAYDKALDAVYLKTNIGGGYHRLFDGGHDLTGAWNQAKDALPDDSIAQEIVGFCSALWKDLTTTRGLPFATVDKGSFDAWAKEISKILPGLDRQYLHDLLTFDAGELVAAGIGAIGVVFCLSKRDQERLSQILGAMGITAVVTANPIMGLLVIAAMGYSTFAQKRRLSYSWLLRGVVLASVSLMIFGGLSFPFFVKLVVAVAATTIIRKQILEREGRLVNAWGLFRRMSRKLLDQLTNLWQQIRGQLEEWSVAVKGAQAW
jgi:hypothetical protein